ncbi:hypothetical protein [Jejuia pallidilutea]|jgi:hypothetical protein|uniref:Uncharacterized protein n=1 Tax=Jejuia pallidilutea TaxID=504487 RepID=A0A090VWU0_9FLAO|nr:hypothetical protein [Jejuia pallidilutea]GAL65174.1 hypothetical protein JCM19301_3634 [Jejuia pallidilutea]GAL69220.1 hypothetical protein JCM19302_3949 [Jejuia pallidilutea]GAL89224.1 hypothetical protein JCM19538_2887 [Jejuia pallidilutea]
MSRDEKLKERWELVVQKLSNQFADGDILDLDAIIYLIGVQELGQLNRTFKKDQKLDLMHIAICKLLSPYGYYELDFVDDEGWPHYKTLEALPFLKAGEQSVLMKEAIVNYFLETEYIT